MPPTRTQHPARPFDVATVPADRLRVDDTSPELVARIASEFREMPGLVLTVNQASRLFDLSHDACRRVFGDLEGQGVLQLTRDGRYRLGGE